MTNLVALKAYVTYCLARYRKGAHPPIQSQLSGGVHF